MKKDFVITRVVTRDLFRDFFAGIRNLIGLRMRTYETMINKNLREMLEEMRLKYKDLDWYRISINPLTNGSVMMTIYGEHGK